MQSWSLIVFFYNEERNIEKVCQQALDFLSPLPVSQKELIFVDDGSTDQTLRKIKNLVGERGSYIKFAIHKKNSGIGAGLKTGYKLANKENIVAVPGDAQFNLNELRAFRNIPSQSIVSFYRVGLTGYSFFRKTLNKINRLINRLLFSVHLKDVNWVKIYKKHSLQNLVMKSKSSFIESEILYVLSKDHKIIEVPTHFLPRAFGHSKSVNFKTLIANFKDIISLLLNNFF